MSDDTETTRSPGEAAATGPHGPLSVTAIDYRALTDPVDRAAMREYRRTSRLNGAAWAKGTVARFLALALMVVIGLVILAVAAVALSVATAFWSAQRLSADSSDFSGGWMIGPFIAIPLFIGLVAVLIVVKTVRSGPPLGDWARWYRLDRFAVANGLVAEPLSPGLSYPGAIFRPGSDRAGYDRIHSNGGRVLDLGNYRFTTRSGDDRTIHSWGYLALQLDRQLPHMLLDSRSNNGLFGAMNLPISVARNQKLRLEGDFNSHFTLYCPHEYEPDALYVFTPDLMALLIDNAGSFDVEIIDDWMFIYSAKPFAMTDPRVLHRLFSIVSTVGAKTLKQTERYRDERMTRAHLNTPCVSVSGDEKVAPEGRRLKYRSGWLGAAFFVAFALVWAWALISRN
ncbi:hypothetical protein GCM10022381_40410 [Leifsonia kafniensis]|uniref:DUF3137 domain-containing protein n=1 Tax=Leifsonia kafniensis TaxID=475957 RepID=A0ABP7L7T6_9MICO